MKMLLESIRKKLGRPSHAAPAETDQGIPFAQESASRRISAPTSWLCGVTDTGRRRRNNEDEYFLSADGKLWIVADGMGGHAAGEVASALTIDAIVTSLAAQDAEPDRVHAGDRLARAFAAAQDVVSSRGQSDADCLGMGSTAIAAIVDEEGLHLCHVGDVRGYHWSQGQFRHVTNDHSLVWELVLSGILAPAEVRTHPQRAKITQAIGPSRSIKPDVSRLVLAHGDRVLVCSDGLWEALADQDLRGIVVAEGSIRDLAVMLVDRANAAGGEDNITAVLYEHMAPNSAP